MLYCEARLRRGGLGNRLFPWARCRIYSRLHAVPMLAPRWAQLPFGTLLRRERDLRTYADLFLRRVGDVGGWRRARIKLQATRIAEPELLSAAPPRETGPGLVVFEGYETQFCPLHEWNELLRNELLAITRPEWRRKAAAVAGPYVAIHVRRGDFRRPNPQTDLSRVDNTATPLSWFVASLEAVRARLGASIPAVVTSDGSPDELRPLLGLDNVRQITTGSAIGDLLVLSGAVLLLASGSSFSAWASYLGRMPTLSHPGQSLDRLFRLKGAARQFIGEFDPAGDLPEPLLGQLPGLMQPALPVCANAPTA
jgi:hypothetical protein